jgi:hypothetical protein
MKTLRVRLCFLLALLMLFTLPVSAETADLAVTYRQVDEAWKDIPVGDLTIAESACGIATICNAVYYLTGQETDLVALSLWAHEAGLFNAPGVPGCYRSVFYYAGEAHGETYGFTATNFLYGDIYNSKLTSHLLAGGTAALHVPGHFMAVIDYDPEKELYLVIDPLPGDYGKYDKRRKGITHTGGDWLTAEQLTQGYVDVDGFALFTRVLSKTEEEILTTTAVSASLAALPKK